MTSPRLAVRPAVVLALVLALACRMAAQGSPSNPNNENDLVLNNGVDLVYIYDDPSIGAPVATASAASQFATNTFFWKVFPRQVMRSCTGALELSGLDFFIGDTDSLALDASGNNTILPDMVISRGVDGGLVGLNPGQIGPDPAHLLFEISFGQGGPGPNNAWLPPSICAPEPWGTGEWELNLTFGTGPGTGLTLEADGSADVVLTTFIPGGMDGSGPNVCDPSSSGNGDYVSSDWHSSNAAGGNTGETMFDVLGTGYSPYGGFGSQGWYGGEDWVDETLCTALQFVEPMLNVRCDTGAGIIGPETGTNGLHFDTGSGHAKLGARLYAWQGIGRPAGVMATLTPPLPICLPFHGGQLGLAPTDPLFGPTLALWQSPPLIQQTDDGYPPTFTPYDDGTFDTLLLPIPALPVGTSVSLNLQGFFKRADGGLVGSQVWTTFLHG